MTANRPGDAYQAAGATPSRRRGGLGGGTRRDSMTATAGLETCQTRLEPWYVFLLFFKKIY